MEMKLMIGLFIVGSLVAGLVIPAIYYLWDNRNEKVAPFYPWALIYMLLIAIYGAIRFVGDMMARFHL